MAMSYDQLVGAKTVDGSIRNWINYTLLPVEAILEDAQAFIYSQLRVREMRATAAITLAIGDSTAPLPTGFLDPVWITPKDDQGEIDLLDDAEVERRRQYAADGTLETGCVSGVAATSLLEFDAASETARLFIMAYYRKPDALAAGNQTNFLTDRYPQILRAACAAFAADFRHDDANYNRWLTRAASLITSAQAEADLSKRGQIYARGFRG